MDKKNIKIFLLQNFLYISGIVKVLFFVCSRVHILQLDITNLKEIEAASAYVAESVGDDGKLFILS